MAFAREGYVDKDLASHLLKLQEDSKDTNVSWKQVVKSEAPMCTGKYDCPRAVYHYLHAEYSQGRNCDDCTHTRPRRYGGT